MKMLIVSNLISIKHRGTFILSNNNVITMSHTIIHYILLLINFVILKLNIVKLFEEMHVNLAEQLNWKQQG